MDKRDATIEGLRSLGLTQQEAHVYLELLQKSATHAQLSLVTGINRTTLYRLANALIRRGLVSYRVDDTGKYLTAADPATLEADVVTQEELAKRHRAVLGQILPSLEDIKEGYGADFAVHTYEGVEGFKRMLWHELKTKGELLCWGIGDVELLILDHLWAETLRQRSVEAGYVIRELLNPEAKVDHFTKNTLFMDRYYEYRLIDRDILPINHMMTVYNDTCATYNVFQGHRVGVEIVSKAHAETIRSMFKHYWELGKVF